MVAFMLPVSVDVQVQENSETAAWRSGKQRGPALVDHRFPLLCTLAVHEYYAHMRVNRASCGQRSVWRIKESAERTVPGGYLPEAPRSAGTDQGQRVKLGEQPDVLGHVLGIGDERRPGTRPDDHHLVVIDAEAMQGEDAGGPGPGDHADAHVRPPAQLDQVIKLRGHDARVPGLPSQGALCHDHLDRPTRLIADHAPIDAAGD